MDASRSTLTRFGDQLYGEWQRGECAEENHREQNTVSNEFAPPNEKLRQLIRDLDSKAFLALLVVYADFAGDRDEVRRAWDVATNDQSPHWKKLNAFYGQSRGGKGRVRSKKADNEPRDMKIVQQRSKLLHEGKSPHEITGIIHRSGKTGLSERQIRRILT